MMTLELFTEDSTPKFNTSVPQQRLEQDLKGSSRLLLYNHLRFWTPTSVFPNEEAFQQLRKTICFYDSSSFPQVRAMIQPSDNLCLLKLSPKLVCRTSCSLELRLPCRKGLGDLLDEQKYAAILHNPTLENSPHLCPHPISLLEKRHSSFPPDCALKSQACKQTAQCAGHLATEISCTLDQVCQQVEETSVICSCRICGLRV